MVFINWFLWLVISVFKVVGFIWMRYLVIDLKSCRVKWFDNVLVSGILLQFVELLYSI